MTRGVPELHEHHLAQLVVAPGHPGERRPADPADRAGSGPFQIAADEARLLRRRLCELDPSCGARAAATDPA